MEELHPSYAPPSQWRTEEQVANLAANHWQEIRREIKQRDDYTCRFCHFRTDFWMVVDHIDGNPTNDAASNLQLLCAWCNSIKHAGLATVVHGHLQLFAKGSHTQLEIVHETRHLRGRGWSDSQIRAHLNLVERRDFKMDHEYLKETVGFLVEGEGDQSIGKLTVSGPNGRFLRLDEDRKRAKLPPPPPRRN